MSSSFSPSWSPGAGASFRFQLGGVGGVSRLRSSSHKKPPEPLRRAVADCLSSSAASSHYGAAAASSTVLLSEASRTLRVCQKFFSSLLLALSFWFCEFRSFARIFRIPRRFRWFQIEFEALAVFVSIGEVWIDWFACDFENLRFELFFVRVKRIETNLCLYCMWIISQSNNQLGVFVSFESVCVCISRTRKNKADRDSSLGEIMLQFWCICFFE